MFISIFSVQEVWGDGDSYPALTQLHVFASINKAEEFYKKRFAELCTKHTYLTAYDIFIQTIPDYPDFDYGKFHGFLVQQHKLNI